MRTRGIKRRWFFYEPFEKDALARMLEAEEAGGWRLADLSLRLVFRRAEPRRARYAAVLVPAASPYDHQPTGEVREYMDYCAAGGWAYVCGSGKWRIFRTEDPDAPAVESDPAVELELIRSLCRGGRILSLVLTALILLLIALACSAWDWVRLYTQYGIWGVALMLPCCLGICVWYEARYALWYRAQKRRAAQGAAVAYLNPSRRIFLVLCPPLAVLLAGMCLDLANGNRAGTVLALVLLSAVPLGLACWGALRLLLRKKEDPESNRILGPFLIFLLIALMFVRNQIVQSDAVENRLFHNTRTVAAEDGGTDTLYQDELPLTLADLGVECDPEREDRRLVDRGRAFLSYVWGIDQQVGGGMGGQRPSLSYQVYHSASPFLFELCLVEYDWVWEKGERLAAPNLSAQEVRRWASGLHGRQEWLLVYEDTLIYLDSGFDLTGEMLAAAEKKLLAWADAG